MRRSAVASLGLAALLGTACHTMAPLSWEDVAAQEPPFVWVTRADDRSTVQMSGPRVFGDTLVGYIGATFHEIPTTEVARVTIKRAAKGKTMALVAAGIVGAAALGIIISGIGEPSPVSMVDCNDVPEDPRCQGYMP